MVFSNHRVGHCVDRSNRATTQAKIMITPRTLEEFATRIQAALPKDLAILGDEFKTHLRATLTQTLNNMDLVTREEFDIQRELLQRTRGLLTEMEARVSALEQQLADRPHPVDGDA
jgi:BMFP domain-containing protein YqiC